MTREALHLRQEESLPDKVLRPKQGLLRCSTPTDPEEPRRPRLRPHGPSFACDSPTLMSLDGEHATICSMMLGQWPLLLCPRARLLRGPGG